jgi:hypothetical protein
MIKLIYKINIIGGNMEQQNLYNEYREAEIKLVNDKIFKSLGKEILLNAARVLDMTDENDNIMFTDENQMGALLDFAIHELRIDGKNAIDTYIETYGFENEMEKKVLKALRESYTSLYRIVNISEDKNMVFIKDLLQEVKNTRLTDIGLSKSCNTDMLIFTRILPFEELSMTSGASFLFEAEIEPKMLALYKKTINQVITDKEANKYIIFYSLFKNYGLNMKYNDITAKECHDENCNHEHHHHHH